MPEWQDATTYARGVVRDPTTWRKKYGDGLSVTVTCGHIHYRGQWVMHCPALGIQTKLMPSSTLEEAKSDAEAYVRSTLLGYLQAIGE